MGFRQEATMVFLINANPPNDMIALYLNRFKKKETKQNT